MSTTNVKDLSKCSEIQLGLSDWGAFLTLRRFDNLSKPSGYDQNFNYRPIRNHWRVSDL